MIVHGRGLESVPLSIKNGAKQEPDRIDTERAVWFGHIDISHRQAIDHPVDRIPLVDAVVDEGRLLRCCLGHAEGDARLFFEHAHLKRAVINTITKQHTSQASALSLDARVRPAESKALIIVVVTDETMHGCCTGHGMQCIYMHRHGLPTGV